MVAPTQTLQRTITAGARPSLRQYEAEIDDYGTALLLDPGSAEVYADRGQLLIALEQCEAGLADFEAALSANPAFSENYRLRGPVLVDLERFDEGNANFNAALIIDPNDAEVRHHLEVAELKKAVNAAGSEILLNPDDMEARLTRGQALVGLQQYAEALTDFEAVLELEPRG